MRTTATNTEAIILIRKAFDKQGFLIHPKSRKNINAAKALLEAREYGDSDLVDGYDLHDSLLIIAHPNRMI